MSAPLSPSGRAHIVGKAQAKFDAIRVDYPPQTSAIAILDEVRIAGLYRDPDVPCGGAVIIAPHGAGKTEAIKGLKRILEQHANEGQIPLLHVEIDGSGTTDSIPTSILKQLGAAKPHAGSEKSRWSRAMDEIQWKGVELIVFDEFNRAARRPTMSGPIATMIRQNFMDSSMVPIAIVGSEKADTVLSQVPELRERLDDSADLTPMNWNSTDDRELFLSYVGDLDRAMVESGLLACETGLAREEIARPLWEASDGRVRRIAKIVRHAMSTALRDGRQFIDREDLVDAVDRYVIGNGLSSHNSFLTGEE